MEYGLDGKTKGEYKGLKAGLYQERDGRLFMVESHESQANAALDIAADKFKDALSRLLR